MIFPPPSSCPANIPPIITKSAPAPNALATSPGFVHPPSEIICAPNPCAASAHSIIADN